jgi:peptide chain release factor subunit 1
MPSTEPLALQLDRLASVDTGPFPIISLYLDLRPNEHGRDQFELFLRKEFCDRVNTYPASGPERDSLDRDAAKIRDSVAAVSPSANGLAVFACHAADLFEAIELAAPVGAHHVHISDRPHLYPLARLVDEYPRYLAVLTDSQSARIFVFATNATEKTEQIEGEKTKHHKKGGWSQARYQRHVENFHLHHIKEVADAVARIVRDDKIDRVFVSAEEVVMPLLREHLPKDVSDRIVDVLKLDVRAPEREILDATFSALRRKDAESDRERVDALIGAYRAGGLGCVGVEATRRAFELGQVDELLITASAEALSAGRAAPETPPTGTTADAERTSEERIADELIVSARNTSAKIRFVEDTALLAPFGGVGAFLRFKL